MALVLRNITATFKKTDGAAWAGAVVRFSPSATQAEGVIVPKFTIVMTANALGVASGQLYTEEDGYLNYDVGLPNSEVQEISFPDEGALVTINLADRLDVAAQAAEIAIRPATEEVLGGVRPDGTTITVDEDGIITAVGGSGAVDSVNGQTGAVSLDADDIPDGATYKQYSQTEKTKLAGIATGATANDTDANLKARANHTGTQLANTISDFAATVRSTVLTGLAAGSNTPIEAADTILEALANLQEQIDNVSGGGAVSPLSLTANNAAEVALTLKQAASQTANIFKVVDDADAQLIAILGSSIYGNNTTARVQLESASGAWLRYSDSYLKAAAGVNIYAGAGQIVDIHANGGHQVAQFAYSNTAGTTRFWVYDVDNAQLEQVKVGAPDSGGSGLKVLCISN